MEKAKRTRLEEEDAVMDDKLVAAIGRLQDVQDELERVNEEASDKVLEVEQKYNIIRRPVYRQRNEVIKNIPDFWLTVFQSHPMMLHFLTEDDQKVIKFLQSLDVEDFKDVKSGYSITFTFKPNPYLEEERLCKVFQYSQEGTLTITATRPRWKPGMALTRGVIKDEKESGKRKREQGSFFDWFEVEETEQDAFEVMDEIADILKDDLWPNPLRYFNQEVDEEEDSEEEDEEEEEEEEENGELEGDEDEEQERDDEDEDDEEEGVEDGDDGGGDSDEA